MLRASNEGSTNEVRELISWQGSPRYTVASSWMEAQSSADYLKLNKKPN